MKIELLPCDIADIERMAIELHERRTIEDLKQQRDAANYQIEKLHERLDDERHRASWTCFVAFIVGALNVAFLFKWLLTR